MQIIDYEWFTIIMRLVWGAGLGVHNGIGAYKEKSRIAWFKYTYYFLYNYINIYSGWDYSLQGPVENTLGNLHLTMYIAVDFKDGIR